MKLIPLTQGKFAKVDDEDYEKVMKYKWYLFVPINSELRYANHDNRGHRHVIPEFKCAAIRLHRFILGITNPKIIIDHLDRDGLNCQKYNLRISTFKGNCANRTKKKNAGSIYLGVTKSGYKWKADITHNKKSIYLGQFLTEEDAALAYNKAAEFYHKEYANLNIIGNDSSIRRNENKQLPKRRCIPIKMCDDDFSRVSEIEE